MHDPWAYTKGGLLQGMGVPGGGKQRGKNWNNCNSKINKIHFFLKKSNAGFLQRWMGSPSHPNREEGAEAASHPGPPYIPAQTLLLVLGSWGESGFSALKAVSWAQTSGGWERDVHLPSGRETSRAREGLAGGHPGRRPHTAPGQKRRPCVACWSELGIRVNSDFGETSGPCCLEGGLGSPGPTGCKPHGGL